jgi:membrane protease subunit HflK
MKVSAKRAEYVALMALILSVVFFTVSFFLAGWSGSFAIFSLSWLILAAALIWLVLVIQFHQRSLAEQEKLEMAQLAKSGQEGTIFRSSEGRAGLFAVAQRRLELFEKWFIPFFSGLIAAYETALGLYLWSRIPEPTQIELSRPLICAIYMVAMAFVSFLISRYATGMAAQGQWTPLRGGGGMLFAVALLCFVTAVGLALVQFKVSVVIIVIRWIVPVLLVVLGAEATLNVILDIYRPRLKGRYSRAGFDSRLLGLINEPGGILRTAATAIDYQFGFKVSQTWFYKLLEKAVVPLLLFGAASLYLASTLAVIGPDEEAVIERFGRPMVVDGSRTLDSGLIFKWPWPIDIIYKYPAKKVQQLDIGFVAHTDPQLVDKPLLWGLDHYKEEYNLLVATESLGGEAREVGGAVPVSLIRAAIPVQYRIKDLYSYVYLHKDPAKTLEAICYREVVRFAASAKIETDRQGSSKSEMESLLGAGRAKAAEILKRRIQARADEERLGVEIVFLGLPGFHPPPKVADDYQQVVGSVQNKQALVLEAQAERDRILSSLAGSVHKAGELYSLAGQYQQARAEGDVTAVAEAEDNLDSALERAKGDIFATLREAQSYGFEKARLARATGERFAEQLKAYMAAPEIYRRELLLAVLEESLENIRKYVVITDPNDTQVFIIDVQEKLTPSLYDISGLGVEGKEAGK